MTHSKLQKLCYLAFDSNAPDGEARTAWVKAFDYIRTHRLSPEDLAAAIAAPPKNRAGQLVMPWGPFAGTPVRELVQTEDGKRYLNQLLGTSSFLPPSLRTLILDLLQKV